MRSSATPRSSGWFGRIARALGGGLLAIVVLAALAFSFGGGPAARHQWTFLDDASSDGVPGFRSTSARGGAWRVEPDEAATGARSLVNRVGEADAPAATLVASAIRARDVHATTRCRVSGDSADGGCGIVFRYLDDRTHHLARIETASGRVVLARVGGGTEHVLATADAAVRPGAWHDLSVEARGDRLAVSWNGQHVIDVHDMLPAPVGTVGLWSPSRSEAYFDELAVEVSPASPQMLEILPLLGKRAG